MEAQARKSKCKVLLPGLDQHNYNWASQVSDAVAATIYCLSLVLDNDTTHAVEASVLVVESVYVYLRCTLDPEGFEVSSEAISKHTLMQREICKQGADIGQNKKG
jgi:hypothetical protein